MGVQDKNGWHYPSKLHPICSGFTFVLSMSLLSLLCKLSTPRMFRNSTMAATVGEKGGSRIIKIIVRFV